MPGSQKWVDKYLIWIEEMQTQPHLEDELIDMYVVLEAKSLSKIKSFTGRWIKVNSAGKYTHLIYFYLYSKYCTWLKLVLVWENTIPNKQNWLNLGETDENKTY